MLGDFFKSQLFLLFLSLFLSAYPFFSICFLLILDAGKLPIHCSDIELYRIEWQGMKNPAFISSFDYPVTSGFIYIFITGLTA